jgi:hypothetical protein
VQTNIRPEKPFHSGTPDQIAQSESPASQSQQQLNVARHYLGGQEFRKVDCSAGR